MEILVKSAGNVDEEIDKALAGSSSTQASASLAELKKKMGMTAAA